MRLAAAASQNVSGSFAFLLIVLLQIVLDRRYFGRRFLLPDHRLVPFEGLQGYVVVNMGHDDNYRNLITTLVIKNCAPEMELKLIIWAGKGLVVFP